MRPLDRQIAATIQWLQANGWTAHVSLRGKITIRNKASGRTVDSL